MATLEVDLELKTDKTAKDAEQKLEKTGSDAGKAFTSGFTKNLAIATAIGASIVAIRKLVGVFTDSISKASEQADAINALNTQLAITGQFTNAVSQDLQNYASELQNVSRFGDEAILSQLAFAQAMGASAEQSKQVVGAGADLAESLNIDLNSAVRNVAKTLGGYAGELGEVIPELKALTTEQLQAGAGVDLIAEKFAGAALGKIRTFSGASAQLRNVIGDLQEAFGRIVSNSPALISVINTTTKLIAEFTKTVNGANQGDPLKGLLLSLISIARTVNEIVIPPFRELFGFIGKGVAITKTLLQGLVAGLTTIVDGFVSTASKIPGAIGAPFRAIKEEVRLAKESADQLLSESVDSTLQTLITPTDTETFKENVNSILDTYQTAIEKSREFKVENQKNFADTANAVGESTKNIENVVKNGLVNTLSVSLQAIGKSLAGAGDGFKGFVGIVLNALGDLAISLGTTIIASSQAIEALKAAFIGPIGSGVAAIGLGAALVAAGAALKAFSSSFGGGGSASPSVGGFGSSAGQGIQTEDQFSQTTAEERERQQTSVQLVVQGDIFDSDETALRLSTLLEKASLGENVKIFGGLA